MKSNQRALLSCTIGSLLGFGTSALAEEASVLEEILVTAQKRSESLQDVPVAISAYTDEVRDLVGITSIPDLTDFTPGLTYSLTQDRMSLRGVGRLTNNYGSDPGIANYADGFYTASTVEAGKRPIAVDRIEILRGPQGTLYGRNSIGGAINIIGKRPSDTFQGEVRATVGSYDTQIFDGSLSGPITDWLRFRVVGTSGGQGKGFFKDIDSGETEGGRNDDLYVEGQLEFDLGERVDGWFKYAHSEWNQARRTLISTSPYDIAPVYFGGLFPNASFNGTPTQAVTPRFTATNPSIADHRTYDTDTPFRTNLDDTHIYTLELIGHLGWADLKYVGGYQGYTYSQVSDFDGIDRDPFTTTPPTGSAFVPAVTFTIVPQVEAFYMEDKEYYSNEINLISTHDGPLQWILGLYQYHEQVNQNQGVRVPGQSQLANPRVAAPTPAVPLPPLGPPNPNHDLQVAGAFLDADARAIFGQIDYSFSEAWRATIGLRYTEDQKDAEEYRTRVLYGVAGVPFAFYNEIDRRSPLAGQWHATTGTAGLQWTPSDDTLTFAKYTRGYKSGGFNAGAFAPGRTGYTEPEFINAYELGLKQTFMNRLTANLSVFYYDYTEAQYPSTVRDPLTNINETRFFNLQKAESRGVELEATWAVTDALQVLLSYGYLDTEIKDSRCFIDNADTGATAPDARPCSASGAQRGQFIDAGKLPSSPENKLAFNANYTWGMTAGSLTLSGTWTYRDEAYYSVFQRAHYLASSYDETDLRLLWNDAENAYTVIAFARNLFDDEGYERVDSEQSAWGVRRFSLGLTAPRTYGIELQFRFGT
jgi:iron complex outermembrane recepter protein